MRLQYKLRESFVWITIITALVCLLISILYYSNSEKAIWSILNNLTICIFTGCIIGCIQSFVGYANEKYTAVLNFYKEAIMLERAVINYPFLRSGFIEPSKGLKDVHALTGRFYDNFKFSYQCLYMGRHNDEVLESAASLFRSYECQIKPFRDMEDVLCDSLRYMDKTDDELVQSGIDIPKETEKIDAQLQESETKIEEAFNDKDSQKKRTVYYEKLEEYLFSKKGGSKK